MRDRKSRSPKPAVSLEKVLEQNKTFGIGMNGEISAVTFGLFAAEDLTAADGSVIPADGLLEILSVDENGHAVCKTDLPFGGFYLKELSTDEHYILSNEKHPIVFEYAGQDAALVEIKANDGKPIDNDLIYGEIHGLIILVNFSKQTAPSLQEKMRFLPPPLPRTAVFLLPMCLTGTGLSVKSKLRQALCCLMKPLP